MAEVWYSSSDCEDPSRYRLAIGEREDMHRPIEQVTIAERCADDFHSNHDGWEARWPRDITLYETKDGPPIASFEVDREAVPSFIAHRKAVTA